MKLSLVIPAYNSQTIIGQTIKDSLSFLSKNHPDSELILINDGSRDNTWEVIKKEAKEFSSST